MAKSLTDGQIAGIVIACIIGIAGIILAIVLPLTLRPKQRPPSNPPPSNPPPSKPPPSNPPPSKPPPSNPPPSTPPGFVSCIPPINVSQKDIDTKNSNRQLAASTTPAINLWLPTFTSIDSSMAQPFYTKAVEFALAFNTKYASITTGPAAKFAAFWINLADGNESLIALKQAVDAAMGASLTLGAVMAVGEYPAQPFFDINIVSYNKLNEMYKNAFTQMAFDVQDILGTGQENAYGIACWLTVNATKIPKNVTLVAFTGGPGVTTENIQNEMKGATYDFRVVGIVELYSAGSTVCLPAQSGCQQPATVKSVVENWTTGPCYKDKDHMAISKALQYQNGTIAGLSVEGQNCPGGCLISLVNSARSCNAEGFLSFAQFSLDEFVQILQEFAIWANASIDVMVYESAFLPEPWLASMNIT